jgi:hypothetical protein
MIDAVLSYQMNPLMGGVSAFNHQLAKRLGVPHIPLYPDRGRGLQQPIVSIKASEVCTPLSMLEDGHGQIFLHDFRHYALPWVWGATRVFAASAAVAEEIRPHRGDVITAHCPGLIENRGAFPSSEITVFTFGHGHKLRVDMYVKLKQLLDATGQSYTVFLSAGLHTGAQVKDDPFLQLEQLFGDHLIFLGILSDRAVAHYLATCTYVAQFFEKGVRENNTTVNAALDAGALVVTNCDEWSPRETQMRIIDIADPRMGVLLEPDSHYRQMMREFDVTYPFQLTWEPLLEKLRG